ncbi:thioredoxin-like protein [Aspergillus steynii IBT 23096]|uniref:Thioredoxin-like protein n=1 Tax=Aspergillus steynii IBT 23096 TaxID=1392250 RepID=A0A2I2G0I1_9EURO|nr:thioredoxin-like protein [Aspergillus steynii IBT 23096]PLB46373.1 thioredoxin-like protein [Aspergillus steynii IBT 23096]
MAVIKIDIISDAICPWCFIGYRNLQRAIQLYQKTYPGGSKDVFDITWKPYFIDQVPRGSELVQDRMLRRMSPEMVHGAQMRLKRVGTSAGIDFKFGGWIGSTRRAHQLLYLARKESSELQCQLSEKLFQYQFEKEADISRPEVLVEAAVQAGIPEERVKGWLASDEGMKETEEETKQIKESGIVGVPHFIIGETQHLQGAEDMEELFQAFIAAREGK